MNGGPLGGSSLIYVDAMAKLVYSAITSLDGYTAYVPQVD
jgi:hypothetical protein